MELQKKSASELGEACEENNNALLAGVIDDAVVEVLSLR
jgi:hypothetical protein